MEMYSYCAGWNGHTGGAADRLEAGLNLGNGQTAGEEDEDSLHGDCEHFFILALNNVLGCTNGLDNFWGPFKLIA